MPVARRCLTCGSVFATLRALREHCSSYSHSFSPYMCTPCNRSFGDIRALQNHLNSSKHANDPIIGLSADSFMDTDRELQDDSTAANGLDNINEHDTVMEIDMQYLCLICHRRCKSARGLELHMASLAHSAKVLKCPFCKAKFKSASGMTMHLEDTCESKITRHQVTAAVHSMVFTPNISIDGRTIEGTPTYQSSQGSQIITTSDFSNPSTTSQLFATEASFNGSCYICPFVVCRKRKFNNLSSLNKHLNSPAHDENQFKCPDCFRKFKLISGFIQHIEGHTCVDSGSATFEQIELQIGSLADFFSDKLGGGANAMLTLEY